MLEALEATIDPDGTVRLVEPIRLASACRAVVIVLDGESERPEAALLSETTLAVDWNRSEEDAAWAHLQPVRSS